jgi:xanthine dehydrogenase accessory factor
MEDPRCVIVYGLNELASAVARRLRLAGHAVALHEARAPAVLRRKMAFSDAWYDGAAVLEGVEVRRADNNADFLGGMRTGAFIPLLTHPLLDVIERWPWDVVIDARGDVEPAMRRIIGSAELTVALGPGAVAGTDCDLVIEIAGPDPGAVIRSGSARAPRGAPASSGNCICSPISGVFHTSRVIGEVIAADELLGVVEDMPVVAKREGRVRGLQRSPRSVRVGDTLAELAPEGAGQVSGVDRLNQLVARSVAFTIDIELKWPAMRFENLQRQLDGN